jgi:hypothetical protein
MGDMGGEPGWWASLPGTEGYVKEGCGNGVLSLHRGPFRVPGRGLFYRRLWEKGRRRLWKRSISLHIGAS